MSESVLLRELDEGIATLTLNRPKALNALSAELRGAIARAFLELRGNPEVGTVILTGSGRAFCAGVDLKEMATDLVQPGGNEFRIDDSGMMHALREFDRPIIGAIHGFAITGGFELALMCDVLIASSEARFADTHARVGVLPGWGLSQKLPRLIGISRAKELSFTGNYIDAEQALAWGLVNRVVAPEELLPTCRRLALDMLSCDLRALRAIKASIDDGFDHSLEEGLRLERERSIAYGRHITPDSIAARRTSVQDRGRSQSGR